MGTVSFIGAKNLTGTGKIDPKGHSTASDVPVGEVIVIVTVPPRPRMMGGVKMPKPPKDAGQMKPPEGMAPPDSGPAGIDPSRIPTIPEKYTKVDSSPLKLKVESGTQEFPIKLTP